MPCLIFLYLRHPLLTIQIYIRMYLKHKQYAPQYANIEKLSVFYTFLFCFIEFEVYLFSTFFMNT